MLNIKLSKKFNPIQEKYLTKEFPKKHKEIIKTESIKVSYKADRILEKVREQEKSAIKNTITIAENRATERKNKVEAEVKNIKVHISAKEYDKAKSEIKQLLKIEPFNFTLWRAYFFSLNRANNWFTGSLILVVFYILFIFINVFVIFYELTLNKFTIMYYLEFFSKNQYLLLFCFFVCLVLMNRKFTEYLAELLGTYKYRTIFIFSFFVGAGILFFKYLVLIKMIWTGSLVS